ncbi:MAG TPA: efflux RND transporter periplasmic adaptor subunit [Gemmatimonadales bacterium]|nr:efflux RND transporter periplasmic adaptor subunit [Gemmatimonadales bacterium]
MTPRPTRRGILLFALVLAAATALVVLLSRRGTSATSGAPTHDHAGMTATAGDSLREVRLPAADARRIGITFAEVTRAALGQPVRAVAEVTYDETRAATVALKVDGWVERLYTNFTGQAVRRGEPLVELYSPMLVTAQEELVLARKLGADVAAGTAEARQGAEQLAESARRRLRYWDVPAEAIERVERTGEATRTVTLRSPVSGVVVEKLVQQGQRIMAGEPILRIADLSTVWVEGEVFERDLASVRVGQSATVDLQALPGATRRGRIAYVYPTLDPATRTARVRVALSNPGLELKPGMYATLRFTPVADTALTVPRSAVLVTGERALAFVKRPDGAFEPRSVVLGRTTEDRLEILSGLAAGDSVVASGTFLVDAESNLGTIMGGMGDMPGMDIRPPRDPGDSSAAQSKEHRPEGAP